MTTTHIRQHGITWHIDISAESDQLSDSDIQFIRDFRPAIFWSDTDCKYWALDEKMPSGRWLENMRFDNALTEIHATVI